MYEALHLLYYKQPFKCYRNKSFKFSKAIAVNILFFMIKT